MTSWTEDELSRVSEATELHVQTRREDGSLRQPIPIWQVRLNDAIYIRSAHGPENGWFRRALATGLGHIDSGGVSKDVRFEPIDDHSPDQLQTEITAAYHFKYDRFGPGPVGAITGDDVAETTLRVRPV